MRHVILASLLLVSAMAGAAFAQTGAPPSTPRPRVAAPQPHHDAAGAEARARTFVSGVHGGKWSATFVNKSGDEARVVVRRTDSRWARAFGLHTEGDVFVKDDEVTRAETRPGWAVGAAKTVATGVWEAKPVTAVRTNSKAMAVLSGAAAAFLAHKFGLPYESALAVISPAVGAWLVSEVRNDIRIRDAADAIADDVVADHHERMNAAGLESVAAQTTRAPTHATVRAKVLKLLGK